MSSSAWLKDKKPIYRHNQQLEELRNLQDKLTQEKESWIRERDSEMKDLEEKREQFLRLQVILYFFRKYKRVPLKMSRVSKYPRYKYPHYDYHFTFKISLIQIISTIFQFIK